MPGSQQAIAAGSNIITFSSLAQGVQFDLPAPQTLRYTGAGTVQLAVSASVTVGQTSAGDVQAELVMDPLGADGGPFPFGGISAVLVAALGRENISVLGGRKAFVPAGVSPANSVVGLRVTAAGVGVIQSAVLAVT